jgi:hypothetical protein
VERVTDTVRNLVLAAVAGCALLVAFWVRSPYMAYAIYSFLLMVIVAHLTSRLWLAGLDCERSISQTLLQQGDEVFVSVSVANRRGWPIPWIFFEDQHPAYFQRVGDSALLQSLMPGRRVDIHYRLVCPKRGYHRIGPLLMETGDLFGLQKRFKTGTQQDYISVLPTIAYIDTFHISAKRPHGPMKATHRIYEDPTRLHGIRQYEPGDPLNRIHWKVTARTGTLHTKVFEPTSVTGGTMILDLHEEGYTGEDAEARMELAIVVTASVAYLLQQSGEQTGLITNAVDAAEVARYEIAAQRALSRQEVEARLEREERSERLSPLRVPTMKTPIQAQRIAESLARVLPSSTLSCADLILEEYRGLPRDAALLPVVGTMTPELAETLAEMKGQGFAVTVFFIRDPHGFEEAALLLAPYNIHVFHIRDEADLHEIAPQRIGQ